MKKPRGADPAANSPDVTGVPIRRIRWSSAYHLIPSRYPPIELFERVAPKADFAALIELESLTNPRVRDEIGNIQLVPDSKRVTGPGSTVVMAPFTHCSTSRPTRFSDGTYGVYYAGRLCETALLEVTFHMERFYAATADPRLAASFRVHTGKVDKPMHDIRGGGYDDLLGRDIATYGKPQAVAKALRTCGSNGIVYPSVRHPGGECIAAFWPTSITIPVQTRHIDLRWDGTRISDWFDREDDTWKGMPS